jgi:hypothetical protein
MYLFRRKSKKKIKPLPVYVDKHGMVHQYNNLTQQIDEDNLEYEQRVKLGLTFGTKQKSRRKKRI